MKCTECLDYKCPLVWKTPYCPICQRPQPPPDIENRATCIRFYIICSSCQHLCLYIEDSEPENEHPSIGMIEWVSQ